jgi:hypothetical protein
MWRQTSRALISRRTWPGRPTLRLPLPRWTVTAHLRLLPPPPKLPDLLRVPNLQHLLLKYSVPELLAWLCSLPLLSVHSKGDASFPCGAGDIPLSTILISQYNHCTYMHSKRTVITYCSAAPKRGLKRLVMLILYSMMRRPAQPVFPLAYGASE